MWLAALHLNPAAFRIRLMESRPIEKDALSFFTSPDVTIRTRIGRTNDVVAALDAAAKGEMAQDKAVSTRYSNGLASMEPGTRQKLIWELKKHI